VRKELKEMKKVFLIVLLVLFLYGCSSGGGTPAPIEERAGQWNASTKCGEIELIVNQAGTAITKISFTEMDSVRDSYSLEDQGAGWSIDENGKFDIEVMKLLDNIVFNGEFSQDATKVTGNWELPSGCSTKWEATK